LFEWIVITFGLKNAGASYQRAMNFIFHEFIGKLVEIYIDDVVVKSGDFTKHLANLRKVLELSRVSVRGTLTDPHIEIIRTQVEALNSTPSSYMCAVVDDRSLEDGNGVERIDQGLSASYRRVRKRARANRESSSARTPPTA